MDDDFAHVVLMNDEGQYALWPATTPVPAGWEQVGPAGSRQECLERVEAAWTDITPRSARFPAVRP